MTPYRWNTSDFALGYDASAQAVHPRYLEIQGFILELLEGVLNRGGLVIDLGGGSGRLMERILDRFPLAHGLIIDQSEPFLALAERRLERFGARAACLLSRLQDDWPLQLTSHIASSPLRVPRSAIPITAILSMSAIHHLEPAEKQSLYQRCYDLLAPGGVLLNGDEVRPASDAEYLATLTAWANHMRRGMQDGSIPPIFHSALLGWIERNVTHFGQPKKSCDDCHETAAAQLAYYRSAGFTTTDTPWHKDLWTLLRGIKPH